MSITWIIPLEAVTSAMVTVASPIITVPSVTEKVTSSPLSIVADIPSVTCVELTAPAST